MGTITVVLDDKVESDLRASVHGKGALGKALSDAARAWLRQKKQEETKVRFLSLLQTGFKMGKLKYAHREELHER